MAEHLAAPHDRPAITGLILAGGAARRLQAAHPGADKGLMPLAGRPLVAWLIDDLAPQTDSLLISANRNLDHYRKLGFTVLPDRIPGQPGPLAGIHAALSVCPTEWLAVAACDTPFLPADWVAHLYTALHPTPDAVRVSPIAYAFDHERHHPLVALLHRSNLPSLDIFLRAGLQRVRQWYGEQTALPVHFDDADAFINLNTPEEWLRAEARLASRTHGST